MVVVVHPNFIHTSHIHTLTVMK